MEIKDPATETTEVEMGQIRVEVFLHKDLVVMALFNPDGDKIEIPMTAGEARMLGKALITKGVLA